MSEVKSQGFEYGVKHFYSDKDGLISEILSQQLGLNNNEATHLLNLGAIYTNNQRATKDSPTTTQTLFRVHTKPRRYNCDLNWQELVVYESADFIILNKPSGIPSHPSVDNILENSLTQASIAIKKPLFITHRLDTLTSGLIVYSKIKSFVTEFNNQIQKHLVEKKYVALVETKNKLPTKLIHYMEPTPRAPKKLSEVFNENWAFCELDILSQEIKGDFSKVKINLITGRTHQIRSQLSYMQAPVMGDVLYGSQLEFKPNAIALRACEIQFNWGTQRLKFNLSEDFDL